MFRSKELRTIFTLLGVRMISLLAAAALPPRPAVLATNSIICSSVLLASA